MIVLRRAQADVIVRHACAGYPREICGLLIGRREGEICRVSRVEPVNNIAAEPAHRFEIDPAARFRLMRELRGTDDDIVGHYHSHPDGVAEPSATDLAMVYEPDLDWLIVAVADGDFHAMTAHRPHADGSAFASVGLTILDDHG